MGLSSFLTLLPNVPCVLKVSTSSFSPSDALPLILRNTPTPVPPSWNLTHHHCPNWRLPPCDSSMISPSFDSTGINPHLLDASCFASGYYERVASPSSVLHMPYGQELGHIHFVSSYMGPHVKQTLQRSLECLNEAPGSASGFKNK